LVDHLLVFEGDGEVRDFPGNYSDYRIWLEQEETKKTEAVQATKIEISAVSNTAQPKKKVSFKDKREFELLEIEMAALNKEKLLITEKLGSSNLPFEELQKNSQRIVEITNLLDKKELRWLELSEMIEGI
ncbi:MAG: ABC transporter ATP-binding protein, partial [Sphingobacteriales bacterium]